MGWLGRALIAPFRATPRRWLALSLLILGFTGASESRFAFYLDQTFSRPALFAFRTWIGAGPSLDPRIKIYGFDDATIEYLDREDLNLREWGQLFQALSAAGAAAIYIDKLFGTPEQLDEQLPEFAKILEELRIPLVTAGWVTPDEIQGRQSLSSSEAALAAVPEGSDLLWLPYSHKSWAYGPHARLMPHLREVGHAIYRGQGEIEPVIRIEPQRVMPHWSLIGVNRFELRPDALYVKAFGSTEPTQVPLHHSSRLMVNFLDEAVLREATYTLRNAIIRTRQQLSFAQSLQKGQVVIILPAMFTGNTDMVATPVGYIPGGYVMASMLNSVLTGQWIAPTRFPWLQAALVVSMGAGLGLVTSPLLWLIGLLVGSGLVTGINLVWFSWMHGASNWSYMLLAFIASSLVLFALEWHLRTLRDKEAEAQREAMQQAAQAVQHSLIPHLTPSPWFQAAGYYQAAEATGGDWFGLYTNQEGTRLYAFIGDVTGHGFSSALLTGTVAGAIASQLHSCFQSPGPLEQELENMASFINTLVYRIGTKTDRSLTMSFCAFDFREAQGVVLNAGHPSPLRARSQKITPLLSRGNILGLDPRFQGHAQSFDLEEGDTILLFTDGLIENSGAKGEKLKPRRIGEILRSEADTVETLKERLISSGRDIWRTHPAADDVTFVLIRIGSLQGTMAATVTPF